MGLVWDPLAAKWREMYAALKEYKARFGDCNVPLRWKENPSLGVWVQEKRRALKKGKLSLEHISLLDEIAFVWDLLDARWLEMFDALQEFKTQFGSSDVPVEWKVNPKFGRWVHMQRHLRKQGKLSPERIKRLDELGFRW